MNTGVSVKIFLEQSGKASSSIAFFALGKLYSQIIFNTSDYIQQTVYKRTVFFIAAISWAGSFHQSSNCAVVWDAGFAVFAFGKY